MISCEAEVSTDLFVPGADLLCNFELSTEQRFGLLEMFSLEVEPAEQA